MTVSGTGGKLAVSANAKWYVPASTSLTLGSGTLVLEPAAAVHVDAGGSFTAGKLELGEGYWRADAAAVEIAADTIKLANHASPGFGKANGAVATTLTGGAADTNTFTAAGTKVTLSQDGNSIVITGSSAADILAMGTTARIYVKDGLKNQQCGGKYTGFFRGKSRSAG